MVSKMYWHFVKLTVISGCLSCVIFGLITWNNRLQPAFFFVTSLQADNSSGRNTSVKYKHLSVPHDRKEIPQLRVENISFPDLMKQSVGDKLVHPPTIVDKKDINTKINEFVQMKPNETKDPFTNLHSYNYTLNSNLCRSRGTFLTIVVHSAPDYYEKRRLIRSTFGSVLRYKSRNITTVFLLGSVEKRPVQDAVVAEAALYGDIVQANFRDSYRALVKKHVMAMHWYTHNCKSEYILKLDDDTFVNPFRIVDYLIQSHLSGPGMWCHFAKDFHPIRNNRSKWHTPESQYPYKTFPLFCLGFAYITTPEAWELMLKASETTRAMNMDDVYSGLLAMRARVPFFSIENIILHCKTKNHFNSNIHELTNKSIVCDPVNTCGTLAFRQWKLVETHK